MDMDKGRIPPLLTSGNPGMDLELWLLGAGRWLWALSVSCLQALLRASELHTAPIKSFC